MTRTIRERLRELATTEGCLAAIQGMNRPQAAPEPRSATKPDDVATDTLRAKAYEPAGVELVDGRYVRLCEIEGCGRDYHSNGLCSAHLARFRAYGDVRADVPLYPLARCLVTGCERDTYADGYCRMHAWRWRRHGDPLTTHTRTIDDFMHPVSIYPVGVHPPGGPMPFSASLRDGLALLERRDAARDARDRDRYDMTCSAEGVWTITARQPVTVGREAA